MPLDLHDWYTRTDTEHMSALQPRHSCTCCGRGTQMEIQASILASVVILGPLGRDTQRLLIKSQTAPRHHLLFLACGHAVSTVRLKTEGLIPRRAKGILSPCVSWARMCCRSDPALATQHTVAVLTSRMHTLIAL